MQLSHYYNELSDSDVAWRFLIESSSNLPDSILYNKVPMSISHVYKPKRCQMQAKSDLRYLQFLVLVVMASLQTNTLYRLMQEGKKICEQNFRETNTDGDKEICEQNFRETCAGRDKEICEQNFRETCAGRGYELNKFANYNLRLKLEDKHCCKQNFSSLW